MQSINMSIVASVFKPETHIHYQNWTLTEARFTSNRFAFYHTARLSWGDHVRLSQAGIIKMDWVWLWEFSEIAPVR